MPIAEFVALVKKRGNTAFFLYNRTEGEVNEAYGSVGALFRGPVSVPVQSL